MSYPIITERASSTDSVDAQLVRNITRTFDLLNDVRLSAVAVSLMFSDEAGIYIKTVHPDITTCFASSIEVAETANSEAPNCHYQITVNYTNNFDSGGIGTSASGGSAAAATDGQQQGTPPEARENNPLLRPVDIKVSGGTSTVSTRQDATGKPYVNSAGDPISPTPQRTVPTVRITIGRNFPICPGNAFQYLGKINDNLVIIPIANLAYPARSLKFVSLDSEPVFENGISYWRVNFTLEQGPHKNYQTGAYKGWVVPMASTGRRGLTYMNPDKLHIITDGEKPKNDPDAQDKKKNVGTGHPLSEPIFLDPYGWYISPDATGSNIHYMDFQPDETFNMNILWS
jgi:hypothetical protein